MGKVVKVVGLCGSPHPEGNTAQLIKKVLEGAQSAGAETVFISLGSKRISFCRACYMCVGRGQCIIEDDLGEIRKMLLECEGAVIGSPTYEREITGQMKTFFDRIWLDFHNESFLGRYAVCVNTHYLSGGHSTRTLINLSIALGYAVVGSVESRLAEFGRVSNDSKAQQKAFRMGIKLVENIQQQRRYFSQEIIRRLFIRPFFKKIERRLQKIP